VRHAKPGYFMCADCHHERDLLTNIARTINGRIYCGGCAAKNTGSTGCFNRLSKAKRRHGTGSVQPT
jgi:hypothetical protein